MLRTLSTLRIPLRVALVAVSMMLFAQEHPDDKSFRYRVQTVDAMFERFTAERVAGRITEPAYLEILKVLVEQERTIAMEAKAHHFADITESNFWHRSRLKFPSRTSQALQQLQEQRKRK